MIPTNWRTSTYTHPNGNCVEVGRLGDRATVRDTKNRTAGYLTIGEAQWSSFVREVASGRYDR
ncbi:DUF397 domain-containing protein [Saccharopolyspora sp. NFXS83]|uniref:DUF397 domain-containing protein n=1 Tax=Saccharopolyspora sp. NFXS83 TaxID=2993560 RepID=UPI00224AA291|nr:DUF397 domain-containing protein [Saccharopolyspora sp. NFXS83]MCX2734292.1 DUF397 domain-containing protein [Saccharopolyspora sp. NFXS83]